MKKRMILIGVMIAFLFAGISYAEDAEYEGDIVLGKVLETVESENIIQVKDRNYKVDVILVDIGMGQEPVMGRMSDLKEGCLVEVYVKGKGEDFWIAEKVIVFKGEKLEEMLKDIED